MNFGVGAARCAAPTPKFIPGFSNARKAIARKEALKRRVRDLKIEINQVNRAKEVAQITESDYFSKLQKKAKAYLKRSPQPGHPQSDYLESNSPDPPESST